MPDLSGVNLFPNDNAAPTSTHASRRPRRRRAAGTRPRRGSRSTGTDEPGGSGVEQIQYRINGGAPRLYAGPFDLTAEGEHKLEYRVDRPRGQRRGLQGGRRSRSTPTAPDDDRGHVPRACSADAAGTTATVTVAPERGRRHRLGRRRGPSTASTAPPTWTAYSGAVRGRRPGTHVVEFRSTDIAGNAEAAKALQRPGRRARRRPRPRASTAPRRSRTTPAPVRVAFTRNDGDGSGAVETEYRRRRRRVDGLRRSAFDLTGQHAATRSTSARSTSSATSRTSRRVLFTIRPPAVVAGAAAAGAAPRRRRSRSRRSRTGRLAGCARVARCAAGRFEVNVSCQGVDRGTLTLTVDRAVARELEAQDAARSPGSALRCGTRAARRCRSSRARRSRKALARTKSPITATLTLRMTGARRADTQTVTFRGKS